MNASVNPSRRNFLKTVVAGSLVGLTKPAMGMVDLSTAGVAESGDWVDAVRAQIPATKAAGYFQTGAFGPCTRQVIDRTNELLMLQNQGPANPRYLNVMKEAENSCRPLIAAAMGAHEDEVALTQSTTAGLNTVIWSIDWQEGDEIITSDQEHPALLLPIYNLHQRYGVKYHKAPIGIHKNVVDEVMKRVTTRTRLVAMSHVSRQSGQVVPAQKLAAALRERGISLMLDGAQGPGNVPVNFHELGCDYYSMCGHKWLLGPKGTGALLVRKDKLDSTSVSWTGAHAQAEMNAEGDFKWHPDARRYELATRNQAGFGGWAESLRWLDSIGWENIHARVSQLSAYASEAIQKSAKFSLVSPSESSRQNGIVVLRLPNGFKGIDLYHRLREKDDMLVSPVDHPRDLRVCLHFFNTESEFDALLGRLEVYCA